jgi:hypothetical protein
MRLFLYLASLVTVPLAEGRQNLSLRCSSSALRVVTTLDYLLFLCCLEFSFLFTRQALITIVPVIINTTFISISNYCVISFFLIRSVLKPPASMYLQVYVCVSCL